MLAGMDSFIVTIVLLGLLAVVVVGELAAILIVLLPRGPQGASLDGRARDGASVETVPPPASPFWRPASPPTVDETARTPVHFPADWEAPRPSPPPQESR